MRNEEFRIRLKKLRERRKIKQTVLSQLCGWSTNKIAKFERGEKSPTLEDAAAIADFFEVTIDYLAGRKNI